MKIVAILGSPHGQKGATGSVLAEMLKGAEAAGAVAATLCLTQYEVRPCCACDHCHKTGACVIKDDYAVVRTALLNADGIILASPNYIFSVTAQLKAVLDRCCGPLHLSAWRDKHAAAVVTGGGDSREVEQYLLRFLNCMGCWTVGGVGATAQQLAQPAARGEIMSAAAEMGRRLVHAVAARETFVEQAAPREAFFQRMRQLVQFRKENWPFEYEYWKSRGWL